MKDNEMTYCGLICSSCPIHLATIETDISKKAGMRISIANELSRIYGTTPKPEIINDCDGCKVVNGRLFTGCSGCAIRICATAKNIENCAWCSVYPCEKLSGHFKFDPDSKLRLDTLRKAIS